MATPRKKPEDKKKPGRKEKFTPEMARLARILYDMKGFTDEEMAVVLAISVKTLHAYVKKHPEFLQSRKTGKEAADDQVERALFERATGYSHAAVKILSVPQGQNMGSAIEQVPYTEHFAPDPVSCIFWLKNRRPDQWRDKVEMNVTTDFATRLIQARERARARKAAGSEPRRRAA